MNENTFLLILVVYCLIREWFFITTIQSLVNKLMSRNYHEYLMSQKIASHQDEKELKVYEEPSEDLSHVF